MKNAACSERDQHDERSACGAAASQFGMIVLTRQQVAIERGDVADESIEAVAIEHAGPRALAGAPAQLGIGEERDHVRGEARPRRRRERGRRRSAESITSLTPPTSVLTPGTPDAIASISATGVPSLRDVSRKTSVAP